MSGYHKNTNQDEAQVSPLSPTHPIKAKASKNYLCSWKSYRYTASKHSEAVVHCTANNFVWTVNDIVSH